MLLFFLLLTGHLWCRHRHRAEGEPLAHTSCKIVNKNESLKNSIFLHSNPTLLNTRTVGYFPCIGHPYLPVIREFHCTVYVFNLNPLVPLRIFEEKFLVLFQSYHHYFLSDFQNLNCSNTTEAEGIFLVNFSSVLYKLTLLHVMKVRCRQNEKKLRISDIKSVKWYWKSKNYENCLWESCLWRITSEFDVFKSKFFLSLFYLFQCEKNVFESTDGPYPQLTVQRWGREGVQWSLWAEQGWEEQVEGNQQAGGSRAGSRGVEQAAGE